MIRFDNELFGFTSELAVGAWFPAEAVTGMANMTSTIIVVVRNRLTTIFTSVLLKVLHDVRGTTF